MIADALAVEQAAEKKEAEEVEKSGFVEGRLRVMAESKLQARNTAVVGINVIRFRV